MAERSATERVMEQEGAFLKALAKVASVPSNGNRLEFRSASGALMVTAARAPGGG